MTEIEHLIETALHGMKALEILATKYHDSVEHRVDGGEWTPLTSEMEALEHIEIRQKPQKK
jgi:hypothetical protein